MSAFFMERLLNQNTYQAKQARYRGLKPIITNENDREFELLVFFFFIKKN